METVTGIFDSRQAAERAFADLSARAEFNRENLLLLTPDASEKKIARVPTDEGEQPGMGAALGAAGGSAAERALSNGLPKDEMFFYEDVLRHQGTLVVAMADSDSEAD